MKLYVLSLVVVQVAAIWPAPQNYTNGTSTVWVAKDLSVTYNGGSVRWSPVSLPDNPDPLNYTYTESQLIIQPCQSQPISTSFSSKTVVEAAVQRAYESIFTQKIVPWKLHPRNELRNFEPAADAPKTFIRQLAIQQTGNDSTFKPLTGEIDESYQLSVATDGTASITAVSSYGVMHGLHTFAQLFYDHSQGAGLYSPLAPIQISDKPKFAHRGLNMDIARNWYPKKDILRMIDALSWNKFNRIHIHMTDAQSWPMDIPALPELSLKGAYMKGLSYTPEDVAEIQSYAVMRGIEPVIEFDMPGHTSSIAYSHPDLIAAFSAEPWDKYCAEPPCGSLKLNSTAVYDFLQKLFADVLPRVSPYTSYFHTGGDEVNVNTYMLDDTVKSNLTSVLQPLMQKFVDRNHNQVRAAGLVPVVWEEMLLQWDLTLGKDVVIQSWLGEDSVAKITAKGHKALFGNYNFWYLDCGKGQWIDFDNGASFQSYYPFLDYCSPVKNWRYMYSYDPTAKLNDTQKALVLGGEVHIWSEQTDAVNLDEMVWPRASAAGEVLWSGRQDESGQNRSQVTASPRLAEWRERMVSRGVMAGPVQMIFCTQLNGTECAL